MKKNGKNNMCANISTDRSTKQNMKQVLVFTLKNGE